jgi:hypothetical protein
MCCLLYFSKERIETEERKNERESCWRDINQVTTVWTFNAEQWYSIGLAAVSVFTFKSFPINIGVLWPWVLPPSPAFSGMSGGPSLGLTVDVLGVWMGRGSLCARLVALLMTCLFLVLMVGKLFCDKMAQLIVSLRRSLLCLPIILPLVPLVWGGCLRARF